MELPRAGRKPVEVYPTATLPDGTPALVTSYRLALCGHGGPTSVTVPVTVTADPGTGAVPITLCGPEAEDTTDALVATAGQPRPELWAWPVNGTFVDAGYIDTIEVL